MELKKDIIIEFVDEDISELLAEQNRRKFISELNSLELKYSVENIEKYAKYLNEKLSFPFIGHYSVDNGMFGKERVEKELREFLGMDLLPRCGGGIGMTRFIRALEKLNS